MRTEANPNKQIVDSYKISSPDAMKEILTLLQGYNIANPTNPAWSRTNAFMFREWKAHNLAYDKGIQRDRSGSVDLDNNDECHIFWGSTVYDTLYNGG